MVEFFKDSNSVCLGCFAQNLSTHSSFSAQLLADIIAIEIASSKCWNNFWLETYSQPIMLVFQKNSVVSWELRN